MASQPTSRKLRRIYRNDDVLIVVWLPPGHKDVVEAVKSSSLSVVIEHKVAARLIAKRREDLQMWSVHRFWRPRCPRTRPLVNFVRRYLSDTL
jgi:hypothetical protein